MQDRVVLPGCYVALIVALISFGGCGSDRPDSQQNNGENVANGDTGNHPTERDVTDDEHCFVNIQPESDANEVTSVLKRLNGQWKHATPHSPSKYFTLSLEQKHAELRMNDFFKTREDINFKRICVSEPLADHYKELAGFRLVELMANNNEGGVAFAIKFESRSRRPILLMTERDYDRWAATKPLVSVESVLRDKAIIEYSKKD